MLGDTQWIIAALQEKVIELTEGDEALIEEVCAALSSRDWHATLQARQQHIRASQLYAMEQFLRWWKEGGDYCAACDDFPNGTQYMRVYAWPYLAHDGEEMVGKRYCWKHFLVYQRDKEKRFLRCTACSRLAPQASLYFLDACYYCFHCVEGAIEAKWTTCPGCGKKVARWQAGVSYCYDCYPITRAFSSQVTTNLIRARVANTAATLTLSQWVACLSYFHEKCAYCVTRPAQVLEHFIPIILGGGTTAENCVPACRICNTRKGDRHPDLLQGAIPSHDITRVKTYLSGEHPSSPPQCGRAVLVLEKYS